MKKQQADRFLQIVRHAMASQNLAALIVPTSDPHNSEYVASRFQHRAKLSNFYGSAGTAVVTPTEALLWTDGRYWLEAAASLPDGWTLQKAGMAGVPTLEEWLEEKKTTFTTSNSSSPSSSTFFVGVDPYTYSAKAWEALEKKVSVQPSAIAATAAATIAKEDNNGVDVPAEPSVLIVRSAEFCGETPLEKLDKIIAKVKALTAQPPIDAVLLTALDDIAWLTNMRGVSDVPYNPVFISYAVIDVAEKKIHLFVDYAEENNAAAGATEGSSSSPSSSPSGSVYPRTSVKDHCAANSIILHGYGEVEAFLTSEYVAKRKVVGVEESQTNFALVQLLEGGSGSANTASSSAAEARRIPSIVANLKGVKNSVELKGFEDCHVRDGCALVRFMAWLTEEVKAKRNAAAIRETDASDKLALLRADEALFRGPSFATISSSGPNGAVIHYHPQRTEPPSDRLLTTSELYLVDSGGQYEDGTTDVTRVLTFDADEQTNPLHGDQKAAYTLVLKGHIALAEAVFPQGVAGYRLDALARQFLWSEGLDYAHGTGHGVGSFLCVHEGPHSVPSRLPATSVPLLKGMILSNEPGYYEDGSYGIRIENLVSVVEADGSKMRYPSGKTKKASSSSSSSTTSLAFKQLTMAPYNKDLIDVSMLTDAEVKFVDDYHATVKAALAPLIAAQKDDLAMAYLEAYTAPLVL